MACKFAFIHTFWRYLTLVLSLVSLTYFREWRCKWSADGDKASLVAAQKLLSETLPTIKSIDGVKGIQRIVCGGCLDFKVITSLDAAKWGDFEKGGHGPEEDFLAKLKAIDGITEVETQTYTIMPM